MNDIQELESLFFVVRTDINSNKLQEYDSDDSELSDDSIVQHVQFQSGISFTSLLDYNNNKTKMTITNSTGSKDDTKAFFDFLSYVTYDHPKGKYDNDDDIGTGDDTDDDDIKMMDGNENSNDNDNGKDLDDNSNCQRGIHKYVWTSNNCCCYDETFLRQPPIQSHTYKLDVIVQYNNNNNDITDSTKQAVQRKIQVSGTDHIAVASTISGILQLFIQSQQQQQQQQSSVASTSKSTSSSITFQAFATTPRLVFPSITISDDILQSPLSSLSSSSSLHLSFVGLNDTNTIQLFSKYFQQIEFKQCTTSDDDVIDNDNNNSSTCVPYKSLFLNTTTTSTAVSNNSLEELTISCTQPEFTKLANQLLVAAEGEIQHNNICTIKKLHLKLHFYLQGDMFTKFCKALSILCKKHLQILIIEYLDIVDSAWEVFFTNAIPNLIQLQQLHLKFTDNFVDNYRRLTEERRTNRTQIVLNSVQQRQQNLLLEEDISSDNQNDITKNPVSYKFQQLVWPSFQQDEVIFTQIKEQFIL